jgi:hypothetical protein
METMNSCADITALLYNTELIYMQNIVKHRYVGRGNRSQNCIYNESTTKLDPDEGNKLPAT